ncbi:MAG: L,D-transpeptidase family protein [Phycisphaerales bacterium]
MVLDSQRARPEASRGGMASGHRRSKMKLPLAIVVVGAVALAAWHMIRASGGTGASVPTNRRESAVTPPPPEVKPPEVKPPEVKPPAPAVAGLGGSISQSTPIPTQAPAPSPVAPTPTPTPAPTAPQPAPAPVAPPLTDLTNATSPQVMQMMTRGRSLIQQSNLVEGRRWLNEALAGQIGAGDAEAVRQEIASANQTLVFSPQVVAGDPYTETRVVKQGELLATIAPAYNVPWRFLAKINNIGDPKLLRVDARLKAVRGPFHVVVHKASYRADVYLDPAETSRGGTSGGTASGGTPMFVRSFPVAVGAFDSTPLGTFIVRKHSKLVNPEWVNPRTGQRFSADNPNNPIGEFWIGLEGTDDATRNLRGYGLHGTIDPASIGQQASMGCVRFLPADIELLFSMLTEEKSRVSIRDQ